MDWGLSSSYCEWPVRSYIDSSIPIAISRKGPIRLVRLVPKSWSQILAIFWLLCGKSLSPSLVAEADLKAYFRTLCNLLSLALSFSLFLSLFISFFFFLPFSLSLSLSVSCSEWWAYLLASMRVCALMDWGLSSGYCEWPVRSYIDSSIHIAISRKDVPSGLYFLRV